MLRVVMKECGKYIVDHLRRGGHFQYAAVAAPELLRQVTERADMSQQPAAISKERLALSGQTQAAPDTIEQLDAQLLFEVDDLP